MTSASPQVTDAEWRAHAAALAATVAEQVADSAWAQAFAVVPRHVFVPRFFRRDTAGERVAIESNDPAQRAQWLAAVYSDTALTTQLGQIDPGNTLRPLTISASSSTQPTLMARMLTDLDAHPGHRVLENGMLARLTVATDGTACGPFLDYPGLFMALRHASHRITRPAELRPEQLHGARHAPTTLDPAVLADPAFAFFCQLHLGSGRSHHHVVDTTTTTTTATVVAPDGSWAQTTSGTHGVLVTFDGTHNPWHTVETAHHTWTQLGRPPPGALGLTVTPHTQYVWCQHPTAPGPPDDLTAVPDHRDCNLNGVIPEIEEKSLLTP